jgi:hypothetical protein
MAGETAESHHEDDSKSHVPGKDFVDTLATLRAPSSAGHQSKTEKDGREVIDWDGPDDPENPFNWSKGYKWTVTIAVCVM